jgi:hypothetical protein
MRAGPPRGTRGRIWPLIGLTCLLGTGLLLGVPSGPASTAGLGPGLAESVLLSPFRSSPPARSTVHSVARPAAPAEALAARVVPGPPRLSDSRSSTRTIRWLLALVVAAGSTLLLAIRRRPYILRLPSEVIGALRAPTRSPPALALRTP